MTIRVFEAFAGIGAPRKALMNIGVDFEVVYTSEINNDAIIAYEKLYGEDKNLGDISKIDETKLNDFDLFVAGFPCQDISHNGKQEGMKEGTRSGLVWDAMRIISYKKPRYVVFENVKNLLNIKFKDDLDKIIDNLQKLGYKVKYELLNSKNFGVCQNRERVFIVGSLDSDFIMPKKSDRPMKTLHDLLVDDECDNIKPEIKERIMKESINPNVKNAIPEVLDEIQYKVVCLNSKDIYNKQPSQQYRVYSKNGLMTTLSAQLNGRYNVISKNGFIRKITPKESLLLQCFDLDDYEKIKDMDAKIYKLSGNSIPVYMLEGIFSELLKGYYDSKLNERKDLKKENQNKMISVVSIFSGGGGIDLGFENAGFDVIYATDFWDKACDTLRYNAKKNGHTHKKVECKDIREVDFKAILRENNLDRVDCFVGGPPCPAYSKSRFYLKDKKRALEDESSFTLYNYFRGLEELNPRVFFFENVNGFVFKPHQAAFDLLKSEADRLGYDITYKVINSANYGVPQTRQRFICVGVKRDEGEKFVFPDETHYDPEKYSPLIHEGMRPWVTCGEAIGDLDYDLPEDKDMEAGSKHKDLLKLVPPGDNYLYFTEERGYPEPIFKWRSRYWSFLLKLSPDRPSWTIQASFSNNQGPFHWKNRFLRIAEIKRIQTFDDDYEITGSMKDQWRQIGNAVPVKLVQVIAEKIKQMYF